MKDPKITQLILVGINDLQEDHMERLQNLCQTPIIITQKMEEVLALSPEIKAKVSVLLVKRDILVNESHFAQLPALSYVGVYGTTLKDIHLPPSVRVQGVFLYCDADTAEFVLIQTFQLIRHLSFSQEERYRWRPQPESLSGLKIGIIGLGAVGMELAKLMSAHGLEVYYTCHRQSREVQAKNWHYVPLEKIEELYVVSNIISIHTPPLPTPLIDREAFHHFRKDCILVNTSLGVPIHTGELALWLKESKGFFISDAISTSELKISFTHPRMILADQFAYKTQSSLRRLGEGLVGNVEACF